MNTEMLYSNHVGELFEVGLDTESYGLHGTSIEAVQELSTNGHMVCNGRHPGKFYFFRPQIIGYNKALGGAKMYVGWNAEKHYVVSRLPQPPREKTSDFHEQVAKFCSEKYLTPKEMPYLVQFMKEHSISSRELERLLRDADNQRKGVLISLSPRINELQILNGDKTENYVDAPRGCLKVDFLNGIEPLGEYEWKILESIQKTSKERK